MLRIANAQLWVHDQDEALAFYTEKLGLEVREDVTVPEMGNFRWLAVGVRYFVCHPVGGAVPTGMPPGSSQFVCAALPATSSVPPPVARSPGSLLYAEDWSAA